MIKKKRKTKFLLLEFQITKEESIDYDQLQTINYDHTLNSSNASG